VGGQSPSFRSPPLRAEIAGYAETHPNSNSRNSRNSRCGRVFAKLHRPAAGGPRRSWGASRVHRGRVRARAGGCLRAVRGGAMNGLLPKRARGRQSAEADATYERQVSDFCAQMLQIRSTMDFRVGSRGWCYILEQYGLHKGDFGAAQKVITDCRKSGALPLDICDEDSARETIGLEQINALQFLGRSRCLCRSGRREARPAQPVRACMS